MHPPTHTQVSELDNYNKLSLWLSLKMESKLYVINIFQLCLAKWTTDYIFYTQCINILPLSSYFSCPFVFDIPIFSEWQLMQSTL